MNHGQADEMSTAAWVDVSARLPLESIAGLSTAQAAAVLNGIGLVIATTSRYPVRCVKCGEPTMRRLDRDVGICVKCEKPVDKSAAVAFRPDCGQFA